MSNPYQTRDINLASYILCSVPLGRLVSVGGDSYCFEFEDKEICSAMELQYFNSDVSPINGVYLLKVFGKKKMLQSMIHNEKNK